MPSLVVMPQLGEFLTEGTVARWLKYIGESVERDEPLCEVSTDKVDVEIPSPAAGVLADGKVAQGQTVSVHTVLAIIDRVSDSHSSDRVANRVTERSSEDGATTATAAVQATRPEAHQTASRTSTVVRRIARANGVDVTKVSGSGPRGRITESDILACVESERIADPLPDTKPLGVVPTPERQRSGDSTREVVGLTIIRREIAEHMLMSRRTSAHVHTVFHVNFSKVARIRAKKQAEFDRAGVKVTYLSFIAQAVSRSIADLAARARSKQLKPDETQGGTFTITNPGMFGRQFAIPIIDQPQSAILGVGAIESSRSSLMM